MKQFSLFLQVIRQSTGRSLYTKYSGSPSYFRPLSLFSFKSQVVGQHPPPPTHSKPIPPVLKEKTKHATHLFKPSTLLYPEEIPSKKPSTSHEVRFSKKKKASVRRAGGASSHISIDDVSLGSISQNLKTVAFCTAEAFDFDQLTDVISKSPEFRVLPELADDVLHLNVQLAPSQDHEKLECEGEIFVFKNGAFVTWSRSDLIGHHFLNNVLSKDQIQMMPHKSIELEEMEYLEDASEITSLTGDTILIGPTPPPELSKLAFSHGLVRSTKVAVLENFLEHYLNNTRHIPMLIASGQKLKLSRSEILVNIGKVLLVRAQLNLSGTAESLLDTPEYYWSRPQLEEYYNKVSKWLDIKPRIAVLNQKLDYAAEFAEVLRGHLSEKHSLKLEWFIIILIAVEVLFEILHWVEKLGYIKVDTDHLQNLRHPSSDFVLLEDEQRSATGEIQ